MSRREVVTVSLVRGMAFAAILIAAALSVPFSVGTVVAAPPGPGYYDQSEYMIGDVAVSVIFPESDGAIDPNSENWSPERVTACMDEITAGLTWWENREPRADLHFDIHSLGALQTSYEPITRPYQDFSLCIEETLAELGFTTGNSFERVYALNDHVRGEYQADWAFTIFVVDSLDDADGCFADGSSARAWIGGPLLFMTFDCALPNGYNGLDNMDRTCAHETGHIFYATDEYDTLAESSGYLNVTDTGEVENSCIMGASAGAYALNQVCSVTREQIGWRDSDNDGILDPVDTIPRTELDYHFGDGRKVSYRVTAEDVPLANQNPRGRGNDVTINTVTAVQYRIDSGPWYDAQSSDGPFDEVTETFSFMTPPLSVGVHVVEARAQNSVGNWSTSYASDVVDIAPDLHGVWCSSPSDVFAVGLYGTILHYDGTAWSTMPCETSNSIFGVWGSSSDDVFAVGWQRIILHWDGTAWSEMISHTFNDLYGIWGTASDDVFAVGLPGVILHYNGTTWSEMNSNTGNVLWSVWGSSPFDVFTVGDRGTILHYDGAVWSALDSGTTENLWGVWGSGPDDVLAVGDMGTILHYDGAVWSAVDSGTTLGLNDIWGSAANDVFVAGYGGTILHYDGTAWSAAASGTTGALYDVWGSSANDVFAVGHVCTIRHYSRVPTTTGSGNAAFSASAGTIENLTAVDPDTLPPSTDNHVFPDGMFSFNITGVPIGGTVTVTIELPSGIPANAEYLKYDSSTGWYEIPYTVVGASQIAITLTDGGAGDSDGLANGTIRDPGGLAVQPPVAEAGGPYTGDEGSPIAFDASGSKDPDGTIVLYEWDLDGDGVFELSSTSQTATFTWPDEYTGTVTLRVTDNDGLTSTATASVTIGNVAPTAGPITAPIDPVPVGTPVNANAALTDPGFLDTHAALWDWGDGTTSAGVVIETGGSGTVTGSHTYTSPGVYVVTLTVTDDDGASGQSVFQYVVVYDPTAGFVTGGGWIMSLPGAYPTEPSLTGKANFGFVAKYQKGASVPTGQTEFQFHVADLKFRSTNYQWLVVSGARAQFKGSGTINGAGDYGFMLTAIDGQINGGGGVDKFRIKIWDKATGVVVYDNQLGEGDDAAVTTAIGGGSIVIHATKTKTAGLSGNLYLTYALAGLAGCFIIAAGMFYYFTHRNLLLRQATGINNTV